MGCPGGKINMAAVSAKRSMALGYLCKLAECTLNVHSANLHKISKHFKALQACLIVYYACLITINKS